MLSHRRHEYRISEFSAVFCVHPNQTHALTVNECAEEKYVTESWNPANNVQKRRITVFFPAFIQNSSNNFHKLGSRNQYHISSEKGSSNRSNSYLRNDMRLVWQ